MTIYWQDGMDLYPAASDLALRYQSAVGTVHQTDGRFGGGCVQLGNQNGLSARPPGLSVTDLWLGFAFYVYGIDGDKQIAGFNTIDSSNNGDTCEITYNSATGVWRAYRGRLGAQLGTAVLMLPLNSWHWVDVRCQPNTTFGGTDGTVEVWVDDVQIINLTSVNCSSFAPNPIIGAAFGDAASNNSSPSFYDDVFMSSTRIGDTRIETLVPTSDASPNDGTPSTGANHYAVVDETQYNTSDYITMTNVSGNKEVYGHGALAGTTPTIRSVQVMMVSQKTNAGALTLQPLVKSSGTEADGSAQSVSTSWSWQGSIFETDPNTSAAWAYGAVNSASIGYKVP